MKGKPEDPLTVKQERRRIVRRLRAAAGAQQAEAHGAHAEKKFCAEMGHLLAAKILTREAEVISTPNRWDLGDGRFRERKVG